MINKFYTNKFICNILYTDTILKFGITNQIEKVKEELNELINALNINKSAKRNYDNLAPTYKKQFNWWIVSAKREETKERRIKETIKLLKANKKLGT